MKKETKEAIIAVAKEGIAKPVIESAYAWLDAWDRLLFGPRPSYIRPYPKNNNVWKPGVTIIPPANDYKSQMFKKRREPKPKPVETPTRKIDADKLYNKVMDAQDELDICSDYFTSANDAYNRVLDFIGEGLKDLKEE